MKDRLFNKLRQIRENPTSKEFIIADAKDGDLGMGMRANWARRKPSVHIMMSRRN
ncbi:MAG TPA: hypothetical protein VIS71_12755 [Terrimicrobium sp.]